MKRQRIRLVSFLIVVLLFIGESQYLAPVSAQSPGNWQTLATGLRTLQNGDKKTAGLGFIVQQQNWPFVSLRGGVKDAGSYLGARLAGPIGIELGQIEIPSGTGSFVSEATDWSHNEMTFSNGSTQLKLLVSRLSPAILAQTTASTLRMLAGNVSGNTFDGTTVSSRAAAPAYPKYIAYSSGGTVQTQALSTSAQSLPALDQNWVLLWYGRNSHFVDTKTPLSYEWSLPHTRAYQGDAPLLLVFQNQPGTIRHSTDGGIDISFSSNAGYVAILPLYGRSTLRASDTDSWAQNLPDSVRQKAVWWASRLCSFPYSVTETYSYTGNTDTATISENINFLSVCSGGVRLAPLPPMLSIAKDALNVTFSGAVVDGNLPTEFGPSMGIEDTQQYTWNISGLKKYTDATRVVTNSGQEPSELSQEMATQVTTIMAGGHWAPWLFLDDVPKWLSRGDLYWANPADIIYHLTEIAPVVPDNLKNSWISYLRTERTNYPPEDKYDLTLQQGSIRQNFSYYDGDVDYYWKGNNPGCEDCQLDAHLKRVPLYNFYSLARFYELTGDTLPSIVLQKAKNTLDKDMAEQDWATGYWFNGFGSFYSHPLATPVANRHLAGLLGFVKLARLAGDSQAEGLGRALFARAAVLRLGMVQYPRYLYTAGLVELPTDPAWQAKYTAGWGFGQLYNYNWTGAYDDARQIAVMDQFQVYLHDHSTFKVYDNTQPDGSQYGTAYLTAYRYMVPELGRLLAEHAKQDARVNLVKSKALFPHWYAAYAEGTLGSEHNLSHPMDSFQMFMADAWIENATPQNLAKNTDIAWLIASDLFYVQKLAETIKAYRGIKWNDSSSVNLSMTAAPPMPQAGHRMTFTISIRSDGGPFTPTIFMTDIVPSGLVYITDSLIATQGTANAAQTPTLLWTGTLSPTPNATISFATVVTESQPRYLSNTVRVAAGPAGNLEYSIGFVVNGYHTFLPIVLR